MRVARCSGVSGYRLGRCSKGIPIITIYFVIVEADLAWVSVFWQIITERNTSRSDTNNSAQKRMTIGLFHYIVPFKNS